ncbi:MAG: ATP-binding cassette domain-containing protein, partial [Terrimicrobiaceae bacterium]|nr:ATP-binding cassette domain-containing protein [Terrimicrobiaceae bacterium]
MPLSRMIEVCELQKWFGAKAAVSNVSFSVARGEVLGFLGPNGAGKSTTMRMLTGFLLPDGGSAVVDGADVVKNPIVAKARLGYLPENAPSYADMEVASFLKFCAEMRGLSGAALRAAVERAIEMCFLEPVRNQSIETLSKGYRHRVGLAQAVIHDPPALVLDEPTDGLDPNQKHEVRQLIRRMGETKAIVFSTHILEEVEAACSRAIIIDRGRVVANGSPAELKARARNAGVLVRLASGDAAACARMLAEIEG